MGTPLFSTLYLGNPVPLLFFSPFPFLVVSGSEGNGQNVTVPFPPRDSLRPTTNHRRPPLSLCEPPFLLPWQRHRRLAHVFFDRVFYCYEGAV